jgi:hypothetical protein
MRPMSVAPDRESRRPIAVDGHAADILQDLLSAVYFGAKRRRRLPIDAKVTGLVARHLVAVREDATDAAARPSPM